MVGRPSSMTVALAHARNRTTARTVVARLAKARRADKRIAARVAAASRRGATARKARAMKAWAPLLGRRVAYEATTRSDGALVAWRICQRPRPNNRSS